jgi:membrane protein DedA with SNARE-associated domain
MDDWIIDLVDATHYWGVAFLMLLETVFPPIPSEVIMTVAGVSAARGNMNFAGVVASGTAGAMLGNWLWFWLAIKFGEKRLHRFIDTYIRAVRRCFANMARSLCWWRGCCRRSAR